MRLILVAILTALVELVVYRALVRARVSSLLRASGSINFITAALANEVFTRSLLAGAPLWPAFALVEILVIAGEVPLIRWLILEDPPAPDLPPLQLAFGRSLLISSLANAASMLLSPLFWFFSPSA